MSVNWNLLPLFIEEGVIDFLSNNTEAQEFMDLLISQSWFMVRTRPDKDYSTSGKREEAGISRWRLYVISMLMAKICTYMCHQNDANLMESITQRREPALSSGINLKYLIRTPFLLCRSWVHQPLA
jgi:hypothetical protein